ncbi:MAG: cold-shock protein [Bacteroidia bacterium]
MAKSQETFNKKEKEKKKAKKRQDKEAKKEERKSNSDKGKSFEDMLAYVDEDGNITSTPPDPKKKRIVNQEDIRISTPKQAELDPADAIRKGIISHFNDAKGYGFIRDLETQESIFVHVNGLAEAVREGEKVTFETEMGQKGIMAVNVKKAV